MPFYKLFYLRDSQIQKFRESPPKPRPYRLRIRDYNEAGEIEAPTPYAVWKRLRDEPEARHGRREFGVGDVLACVSHHPTAEACDTTVMTSLRLLAVLDVPSSTPARAKRRAPRPDGPLTHFTSPRGETCRPETEPSSLIILNHWGFDEAEWQTPETAADSSETEAEQAAPTVAAETP
ncbi:MAG: hypothetical protein OXB98_06445 [Bryobacterales bacterium]|nr:hypothetical protein [Bryobacterales bacterium]